MAHRHLLPILLLSAFVPVSRNALAAFLPASAAAAVILEGVRVRVYNATPLDAHGLAAALEIARTTLRTAAAVDWLDCTSPQRPAACAAPPTPGELVLRIVQAGHRAVDTPSGAVALRSPNLPVPLGDAFVDLGSQSGVLGTIYLDRVTRLASAAGARVTTLLGHAIAHELGHLLLGTSAHSRHGLMRSLWSRDEVRRGRAADWSLADAEASAIRARLARR